MDCDGRLMLTRILVASLLCLPLGVPAAVKKNAGPTEPTVRQQLETALEENRRLQAELATVKAGTQRTEKNPEQQAEIERLNTEVIAIRQASATALQIQEERDRLQERVIHLERDLETTRRERNALAADQRQSWFLIGAGVLFGGILTGIFLPKLNWRKKSHWDSF